jgi:hypothetical protein
VGTNWHYVLDGGYILGGSGDTLYLLEKVKDRYTCPHVPTVPTTFEGGKRGERTLMTSGTDLMIEASTHWALPDFLEKAAVADMSGREKMGVSRRARSAITNEYDDAGISLSFLGAEKSNFASCQPRQKVWTRACCLGIYDGHLRQGFDQTPGVRYAVDRTPGLC